ncbi:MAG: hypothetical protein GWO79_00370 [Actinobacteria bacterium]|nr:hypothetical protein [Actinomycetota bacterium]
MDDAETALYNGAVKEYADNLEDSDRYSIAFFVQSGTPTTKKLGANGRAGILNSYKSAFNKLPQTESEWQDAVKIANGRWPSERNRLREADVYETFRKIFLREPDRADPYDDAAIMIMAYGLLPAPRNINSEKISIRIFQAIYGYVPQGADDWNIIQAIAYSGAKRR